NVLRLAEIHAKDQPAWRRLVGAVLFRDGQHAQAIDELTHSGFPANPWDLLFLAMAHEKNGSHGPAIEAYDQAESLVERRNDNDEWKLWHERVEVTILQREAAALLNVAVTHAPTDAEKIAPQSAAPSARNE